MSNFTPADQRYMRRALRLAVRGKRTSAPNPAVGCVLVKDGRIVGEGFHAWAGEAHAEIRALDAAGEAASGATAYVTLEPCSHHGRTPPCTGALIGAGVGRVVVAMRDWNPKVNGAGLSRLRAAGIATSEGLYEQESQSLNRGFFRRISDGRPWLTLKVAASLDGKSALADGGSRWVTGPVARAAVHRSRARAGAVLTGIGTVLADDPALNVRLPGTARQPLRVILDSKLRTPPDARLFGADGGPVHIFCTRKALDRRHPLENAGATVHDVEADSQGKVGIDAVLRALAALQVNDIYAECGPTLAGVLLAAEAVDELDLFLGPHLLGAGARSFALLEETSAIPDPPRWRTTAVQRVGRDTRIHLQPAQEA
ncbi:MAG: bifunctional diaminohydroxyphosphoribosylaminopyrimidine deaminase/5-amino-6-(5-phosphoribosylamino)uracil reductase RibD [Gammaproteobacteria bacterium]|nr:bifunctional diaminohydroxyphosphoribosylaminopyrimidine deaminase/5-amino-6-(5-phosphoribosylamino)uracil reductase RibD [Gammaproteobacteria bacterium]